MNSNNKTDTADRCPYCGRLRRYGPNDTQKMYMCGSTETWQSIECVMSRENENLRKDGIFWHEQYVEAEKACTTWRNEYYKLLDAEKRRREAE